MRVRAILLPLSVPLFAVLGGVLFAHTSGIVVPPSHVGQTVIVVTTLQAESLDTTKVASPTELVISAPVSSDGGLLISANLTSTGNPLVGEPVEFYLGAVASGIVLCSARTGSDGAASCNAGASRTVTISDQGYVAVFEGDRALATSITSWPGATP